MLFRHIIDVLGEIAQEAMNVKIWQDSITEDREDAPNERLYLIGERSKDVKNLKRSYCQIYSFL